MKKDKEKRNKEVSTVGKIFVSTSNEPVISRSLIPASFHRRKMAPNTDFRWKNLTSGNSSPPNFL